MIFRRKKKETSAEQRRFYRRKQGKKHALSVKIKTPSGVPLAGDLIDVSAGGVAVAFSKNLDPRLESEEEIAVTFSDLAHGGSVVAQSRVLRLSRGNDGPVYHMEFTATRELFAQLDGFYMKFFNRRRLNRALPALDTRIAGELQFGMGAMPIKINDITLDGFGVRLTEADGSMLNEIENLVAAFTLPGSATPIVWNARTVHLSPLVHGVGYGATFAPDESIEFEEERQVLQTFIEARLADMSRWDETKE